MSYVLRTDDRPIEPGKNPDRTRAIQERMSPVPFAENNSPASLLMPVILRTYY